ncbi:hypothetical protein MUU72_31660 [Streptomyces sp. RS10V-4]|uniref:hypothetical protein n=1 Tax=Streptomyces rhizoryzae TaxID=2932493 RepID=UPI00200644D0|nr:hypothetical protein [Streptomyces rhizoryzae]MCK7627599.1 hypothetical protein [Streptomyces rhizoryzae]
MLLLMGVVALIVSLMNRTPAGTVRKRAEIRVPEPDRGREYTVWLARQQGYDLSHRVGARVARHFVFRPSPHYWPPKLGGPVGEVFLPAGYPPPSAEELLGIGKEIRRTENLSNGLFLANCGLSSGVVYGGEALRRWCAGGEVRAVVTVAVAFAVIGFLATLKLSVDYRRRRRRFNFSAPGGPRLAPLSPPGAMPPAGTGNERHWQ